MQINATELRLISLLESLPGVTQVDIETSDQMVYREYEDLTGDVEPVIVTTIRAHFDSLENFNTAQDRKSVLADIEELIRVRPNAYRVISVLPKASRRALVAA